MQIEQKEITVPGQLTGPARLTGYILKESSGFPRRVRPAVVICPGGGYHARSEREQEPVAHKFLAMGCHVFLMDYSVAPNRYPVSVRELAEAVAYIRERARGWRVDPNRIVVCGFSAGGHLACSLGVLWNRENVFAPIKRSPEQRKPDGMILCYPVITGGRYAHTGSFSHLLGENATEQQRQSLSLELLVTEQTPPAFIWHTMTDDTVPVENSLLLTSAMSQKGVSAELHIYPRGGHGLSLADAETAGNPSQIVPCCQSWIPLVKTWLENFRP